MPDMLAPGNDKDPHGDASVVAPAHSPALIVASINRWLDEHASLLRFRRVFRITFSLPCALERKHVHAFERHARIEYLAAKGTHPDRVVVIMPTPEHDTTARVVERKVRKQLFEGGFYWGTMLSDGIKGIEKCGPQAVSIAEGSRQPDGSLYIPTMMPSCPFLVIEVGLSESYRDTYEKCKMWLCQPRRRIRYAILVKINRFNNQQRKIKLDSAKKGGLQQPDLVSTTTLEMDGDESDEATKNAINCADYPLIDETLEEQRRRTHKFHSVTVSVLGVAGGRNNQQVRKIIDQMEVWPAAPHSEWEFTWAEMAPGLPTPSSAGARTVGVSFTFLHELFETKMVRAEPRPCQFACIDEDLPELDPDDVSSETVDSVSSRDLLDVDTSDSEFPSPKCKQAKITREHVHTRSDSRYQQESVESYDF
ncbi:hypothetical protein FN846DRAFT_892994 [Sphaerosporella brunnea]|uniref:Uncharacterized protein n=1 Tax=Sphaerosporella brunnea TaxID=1250544 RepID=A0A5J5EPU0_9PEZI|nr:hypothetical protein FN846DRAFT_892994 [Sphaerosporella brunnea]